ncbi:MAG TPA: DUF4176 domain-containing protein [Ligilactobacillus acidipiscis]|uniref:DUF4176 domain-containing protein n=1 Tax=Ligilactobacillus acidipiscis TaxID=89059 RepID=A0A921K162_9LACO|nr:DUF4176 domain-containing protein [Ligilactobacillus acidipiscis]
MILPWIFYLITYDSSDKYYDYVEVEYPGGIDSENTLFFKNKDIDKVVFRGYEDEKEKCYLEVYC